MPLWIALLRGINVSGRNRVPMAELRALSERLGWADVATYIASGNLLFRADGEAAGLAAALRSAVERELAVSVPAIVRPAAAWAGYLAANPFPEAAVTEPERLMLALTEAPPLPDAAARMQERAADGERVREAGGSLWIHFPAGSARSRLTPAVLDRLAGSPLTTRNWRTAVRLGAMVAEAGG